MFADYPKKNVNFEKIEWEETKVKVQNILGHNVICKIIMSVLHSYTWNINASVAVNPGPP